jgi:deazaflavin-dependent oxidoreductase (nitroreductase family)
VVRKRLNSRALSIIASTAGADSNPDWIRILVANLGVTVEIGTNAFAANAVPVAEPERDRIYSVQTELNPGFAEYQTKTTRVIPAVEFDRTRSLPVPCHGTRTDSESSM